MNLDPVILFGLSQYCSTQWYFVVFYSIFGYRDVICCIRPRYILIQWYYLVYPCIFWCSRIIWYVIVDMEKVIPMYYFLYFIIFWESGITCIWCITVYWDTVVLFGMLQYIRIQRYYLVCYSIFGYSGQDADDVIYINWLNMARAGLLSLEFYSPDTKSWRQVCNY